VVEAHPEGGGLDLGGAFPALEVLRLVPLALSRNLENRYHHAEKKKTYYCSHIFEVSWQTNNIIILSIYETHKTHTDI
jgi:hypothetical protein